MISHRLSCSICLDLSGILRVSRLGKNHLSRSDDIRFLRCCAETSLLGGDTGYTGICSFQSLIRKGGWVS